MAVWVIRGGRYGEREEEALDNKVLTIGFGYADDLSKAKTLGLFTEGLPPLLVIR